MLSSGVEVVFIVRFIREGEGVNIGVLGSGLHCRFS